MKTKMILNVHSILDVITNSSTELFVFKGNKSIELVEQILEEMWIKIKPTLIEDWNKFDRDKSLEDILVVRYPYDKEINVPAEDLKYIWGYEGHVNKDTIIIESVSDNSICSEFMDEIEYELSTDRYHLG